MGIASEEWRRTLERFLLHEYCEWVFLGNKYGEVGENPAHEITNEPEAATHGKSPAHVLTDVSPAA